MLKVKASLVFKDGNEMPKDIIIDIPKSECNRTDWNDYIKGRLMAFLSEGVKIEYELM